MIVILLQRNHFLCFCALDERYNLLHELRQVLQHFRAKLFLSFCPYPLPLQGHHSHDWRRSFCLFACVIQYCPSTWEVCQSPMDTSPHLHLRSKRTKDVISGSWEDDTWAIFEESKSPSSNWSRRYFKRFRSVFTMQAASMSEQLPMARFLCLIWLFLWGEVEAAASRSAGKVAASRPAYPIWFWFV